MAEMLKLECDVCGAAFAAEKKPRGRHPRFCSSACRAERQRANVAAWNAAHPHRRPKEPKVDGSCVICGAAYVTHAGRAWQRRYCSEPCRRAAQTMRTNARKQRKDAKWLTTTTAK